MTSYAIEVLKEKLIDIAMMDDRYIELLASEYTPESQKQHIFEGQSKLQSKRSDLEKALEVLGREKEKS